MTSTAQQPDYEAMNDAVESFVNEFDLDPIAMESEAVQWIITIDAAEVRISVSCTEGTDEAGNHFEESHLAQLLRRDGMESSAIDPDTYERVENGLRFETEDGPLTITKMFDDEFVVHE